MHWVTFSDGQCVGVETETDDPHEIFDMAWLMINEEVTCQSCGAKWTGEGRLNYWRDHQKLGLCNLMTTLMGETECDHRWVPIVLGDHIAVEQAAVWCPKCDEVELV